MCVVRRGVGEAVVVADHSCRLWGFEAGRDFNVGLNVLPSGLSDPGIVHSGATPAETRLPADAADAVKVSAQGVVERGKHRPQRSRVSG